MISDTGNPGTVLPSHLEKASSSCFLQLLNRALTFLGLIGVIVDPTMAGIGDSDRAMSYSQPWDDRIDN